MGRLGPVREAVASKYLRVLWLFPRVGVEEVLYSDWLKAGGLNMRVLLSSAIEVLSSSMTRFSM